MIPDSEDVKDIMPLLEDYASRASFIIEIGCGDGNGSLRALSRGFGRSPAEDKFYASIEIRRERPVYDIPTESWWHLYHGDSTGLVTLDHVMRDVAMGRAADLIFVDANHTYRYVKREIEQWKHFARRGRTVWLFHDIWMHGRRMELTDAILEYAAADGWVYDEAVSRPPGLGRLR